MKALRLKEGHEHFKSESIVQLALLKQFCRLSDLDIPTEKLMEFLEEGKNLMNDPLDQVWEQV